MSLVAERVVAGSTGAGDGTPVRCRHCGVSLAATAVAEDALFCTAGCAQVYELVQLAGLGAYYDLRDAVIPPADGALLPEGDWAWLVAGQQAAEQAATVAQRAPTLIVDLQGISCAGCVWLIERLFRREPGAVRIELDAQLGRARLTWRAGEFDAAGWAAKLQKFNYQLGPVSSSAESAAREEAEGKRLGRKIGLCSAFAMNVMLFALPAYFGMESSFTYAGLFTTLSAAFATAALVVGGTYFLASAVRALRVGALHLDLPIALGILGSYTGSMWGWISGQEHFVYFDFVASFILLMLVGRWAQVTAIERNRRRLLARLGATPRVRLGPREVEASVLRAGDAFTVAPAGVVPVAAEVLSESVELSLASINGEAEPRLFRAGQPVPAGAINLGRAPLALRAREAWAESLLARLMQPVVRDEARHTLFERVIRGYLIGVIATAVLAGVAWWQLGGDAQRALAVVTAVLVVSCPCALGLAVPLADEWAVVALRRRGVFVRVGDLWARLGRVRRVVFDKTGTLTLETPELADAGALRSLAPAARAALHLLVQDNPHPVSRALHEALLQLGLAGAPLPEPAAAVRETVGLGVAWTDAAGVEWRLGRPAWADARRPPGVSASAAAAAMAVPVTGMDVRVDVRVAQAGVPLARAGAVADADATVAAAAVGDAQVVLACEGVPVASFVFRETVRPDVVQEIAALRARGLAVEILSGDRPEKVAALAATLGLPPESARGGLSPTDKAAHLSTARAAGALVLGDGANDSLAFDAALCRGTPVIHRGVLAPKADFYYLGRGIAGVRALLEVNAARRRTEWALVIFMIAYNLASVGAACAGFVNPLVAAILMPVSSLATLAMVGWGMRSVRGGAR